MYLSVFLVCEKNTLLCPYECCHHSCRMVSLVVNLEAAVPTLSDYEGIWNELRVIPEGG